jgi:uncharacterized protein
MDQLPVLNCDGCGACCRHINAPPGFDLFALPQYGQWGTLEENPDYEIWFSMPDELRQELREYYLPRWQSNEPHTVAPCIWYDAATQKCKHHEHRPTTCRDFEIGNEACLNFRVEHGID